MYAIFVRLRDNDKKLRSWTFTGIETDTNKLDRMMDDFLLDGTGQIVAHHLYTAEYVFYSAPVDIPVYQGDELLTNRPYLLNIWKYDSKRLVWGLWYGGPTHMSYEFETVTPERVIVEHADRERFYFDAGRKLNVLRDDLKQGFKDLGIWTEPNEVAEVNSSFFAKGEK